MKTIAILGGIATGKTTLAQKLEVALHQQGFKINSYQEPSARNNPYFSEYERNPKNSRNTLLMQRYFLMSFLTYMKRLQEVGTEKIDSDVFVADTFPPLSGKIYSMVQNLLGFLSNEDWLELNKQYEEHQKKLKPSIIINCFSNKILTTHALHERDLAEWKFYMRVPHYQDVLEAANHLLCHEMSKHCQLILHFNPYNTVEDDYMQAVEQVIHYLKVWKKRDEEGERPEFLRKIMD